LLEQNTASNLNMLGMEEEVIKSAAQTFSLLHHWFNNTAFKLTQHES